MASREQLRDAIEAMIPPAVHPQFVRAKSGTLPWTLVTISIPAPVTRAMNTRVLTSRVVVRCLITGGNERAVWQLADLLLPELEGVRVIAPGWKCSPMQQLNTDPRPYQDDDVVVRETDSRPVLLPLDFDFYATTTEETP